MTSAKIAARNRANAQKSTGPKTAKGKAAVAGNAVRHGLMSRPDPKRVQLWLSVILGRPELTPKDLVPEDEYGFCALALAEAEVRLAASQAALEALLSDPPRTPRTLEDMQREFDSVRDLGEEVRAFSPARHGVRDAQFSIGWNAGVVRTGKVTAFEHRRRLLTRYMSEARARRRRAFAAWIEINEARNKDARSKDAGTFYRNKARGVRTIALR